MRQHLNVRTLTTAILVVAVVILGIDACNQRKKRANVERNYSVVADSLRVSVNKLGQQEAVIRVFEVNSKKDFLQMETKDSTIRRLQGVVKDYSGRLLAATVGATETRDRGSSGTTIQYEYVTLHDTVVDSIPMSYSTRWSDKWSIGTIWARPDSIFRDIKVINEFEETVGYGRWNPFKRRELEITLLNKNPNTVTTELRSVKVKMPEHRIGFGFYAGYGMTATLDGDLHHGFQAGAGIHYRVWP